MNTTPTTTSPLANNSTSPQLWALAAAVALPLSWLFLRSTAISNGKVHDLGGIPILTAWPFFTKRFEFIRGQFKKNGGTMFRFRILQDRVNVVSGVDARRVFFTEQSLDVAEGYMLLSGGAPRFEDIDKQSMQSADFVKRVLSLLRKDRVEATLPKLLEDVNRRMDEWGTQGKLNPFNEVYDLVFQMTVRMATCEELSADVKTVEEIAQLHSNIEKSATPVALMLPWFPSPARRLKKQSTSALYDLLLKYIQKKRNNSTAMDPIDILIHNGDCDDDIVGTIMGIIFAGIVNTGVNSCWALLHLGTNPLWKAKAVAELKGLIANHTDALSPEPFHKQLALIPLEAWEDEVPCLDLIIRETLRISMSLIALRRNLNKDVVMEGIPVKKAEFVAYSLADVHLNPKIYPEPEKFDPGRYEAGREEDKKEPFAYIGWGVGRHPCPGMRMAKLEMKLILAMMLIGFDYTLADVEGNYPKALPKQDRNDFQQSRPMGDPVFLKYTRIKE